jgi:adenylate cyclase
MRNTGSAIPKSAGLFIRRTERGTRIATAMLGALLTLAAGLVALLRIGDPLVSLSYDLPFIVHRAGGADDIRIVYLNELDKQFLNRGPQALLLDRLGEAGARMVVYDIIFDLPSTNPEIDKAFAESIRRFRGVDAAGNPIPGAPRRQVLLACGRKVFQTTGMAGEQLVPPTDLLLDAADDFGLVAVDDDTFRIRKLPTGSRDESSLVWKAAQHAGSKLDENRRMDIRWMNYAGPPQDPKRPGTTAPIQSCGADSLLRGGADPWFFRNKIVVIGGEPGIVGEALGKDLFETPFHRFQIAGKVPLMSGVEVQANALANLLQHNWLVRSTPRFDLYLIVAAGLLIGAGLAILRPLTAIVSSLLLVAATVMAGVFSMHFADFWFPWSVTAFIQLPVALVWGIASQSYLDRFFRIKLSEEQQAIRAAFSKYLSPQMLERLTAEGFNTNLGGEKVHAAMMFTDLENFTDMCERVGNPQRIVETLNGYFERTTGSIFDDDGVIIKFIGDAIFAAWGAPLADPDAPVKAVRAAWKLYQSDKLMVDGRELRTRIGLHYGEVVAGNIGSTRRVDYTLIGDAVNLTSRLEGINKLFDTSILMSDAIHAHLDGEFRTRRVGKFRVKGRKEVVVVHELLGPAHQEQEPQWITEYHEALAALDANDVETAIELFTAVNLHREPRGDGPSQFFIEHLKAGGLILGGIFEMKEK